MDKKNVWGKLGKVIWNVVQVLIILYVILITFCILMRNRFGYTQFNKYTFVTIQEEHLKYVKDSHEGDLLLVKESDDIEVGELIYYYAVSDERYVVRSGVVKSISEGETTSLYLLDDDNNTSVAYTRVLGIESSRYSVLGGILDILSNSFGFLFLVFLPILSVFIYQVYEFVMVLKYEKSSAEEIMQNEIVEELRVKEENKTDDDIEIL